MRKLLRSLRRAPASRRYLPEVDGLRALAVGNVVWCHVFLAWAYGQHRSVESFRAAGWPAPVVFMLTHAELGVMLFFAISGYILALPAAQAQGEGRRINLRNYYLRRVVRIEPPYFIITTGFLAIYLLENPAHIHNYGPHYAASMGYVHNLLFPHQNGLNDVAWSLEVEVQFYLLAPLLFGVFKASRRTQAWIIPAAILILCALPVLWPAWVVSLYQYAGVFAIGIGVAALSAAGWKPGRGVSRMLAGGAAGSGVVLLGLGAYLPRSVFTALAPGLIGLVLLAGILTPGGRRIFRLPVLAAVGGMCYSIYLTHNLLIVFLVKYGLLPGVGSPSPGAYGLVVLLSAICVLGVGVVTFKLIEQPFMRLGARFPLFRKPGPLPGRASRGEGQKPVEPDRRSLS